MAQTAETMTTTRQQHGGLRTGAGRPRLNGIGCERKSISICIGDWNKWSVAATSANQTTSEWLRTLANSALLPRKRRGDLK